MEQNAVQSLAEIINQSDSLIFDESILQNVAEIFSQGEVNGQKIAQAREIYSSTSEIIRSKKSHACQKVYAAIKKQAGGWIAPLSIASFCDDDLRVGDLYSARNELLKVIDDKKNPSLCSPASALSEQIFAVLKELEQNLDIFEKQAGAIDIFETMAYASTFALLLPKKTHTLLVQNPAGSKTNAQEYVKLFDAFFGLAYSAEITPSKKLQENHLAKNWQYPCLKIVSQVFGENSAVQCEVLRDTQKVVCLPSYWDGLAQKRKDRGITAFKQGIGKINVLLTVVGGLDSILLNSQTAISNQKPAQMQKPVQPYVKDGKVLPCIGVMSQKIGTKRPRETRTITKIDGGDSEMTQLIDEQKLRMLYETMRLPASGIKSVEESGELEAKINGYATLLDLAQKVKANNVSREIRIDLELIRRYIGDKYDSSFALLESERATLLGEKDSIDKKILKIDEQIEIGKSTGKSKDKYLLLLDKILLSAPTPQISTPARMPVRVLAQVPNAQSPKQSNVQFNDQSIAQSNEQSGVQYVSGSGAKNGGTYFCASELSSITGAKKAHTIVSGIRDLVREGKIQSRPREKDANYTVGRRQIEYELNEALVKVAFKDESIGLEFLAKALAGENVLPKVQKKDFKDLLARVSNQEYFSAQELTKYDGVQKLTSIQGKLCDVVRAGKIVADKTLSDSRRGPTTYRLTFDALKEIVSKDVMQTICDYVGSKA